MHELLRGTILPFYGMYDDEAPFPPTSMYSQRIGIAPSHEPRMLIL
jgi:hypothetical protein